MTSEEINRYSMALAFASKKHANQCRKNNTPYILHPIKLSMYVAEAGFDVNYQIAALFHDLLEDTDATEAELKEFVDDDTLQAIKLVTKTEGYNETEYINNILKNPIAKVIKNADRIDNLRDLRNQSDVSFMKRYIKNTEEFFKGRFSDELDALLEEVKSSINS